MTRCLLFLFALTGVWSVTAQAALIEGHYDDAALFIVATAYTVDPAQPVHSLAEYETVYGHFAGVDYGALAAALYFANGGQRLYVIDPGGASASDFQQALTESTGLPVSLVALPGASCCISDPGTLKAVMQTLIQHVASSSSRFALIDAPENSGASELLTYRAGLNSTHAALYAPWLIIDDANATGGRRAMPPSAAVAGVIARIDRNHGVFEAPAGLDTEFSALLSPALERDLASVNEQLNTNSINVLREFAAANHPVIWGARVLDASPSPYVSRYRYLRHLRYSIDVSLHSWFSSAGPAYVPSVVDVEAELDSYLHSQWILGAMAGQTPQEAWFSSCTLTDLNLQCQVGVALLRAAEFDVFSVQWRSNDVIFQSGFEWAESSP